jgi:hypothetical protein
MNQQIKQQWIEALRRGYIKNGVKNYVERK